VRSYIHHFNPLGREGLQPHYGGGRPLTLNWIQVEWLDVLAQSPTDLPLRASAAGNWTQALLRQYLKLYYQIEVRQPTIGMSLRNAGNECRRAKLRVCSPDPLQR
jgi:transposase